MSDITVLALKLIRHFRQHSALGRILELCKHSDQLIRLEADLCRLEFRATKKAAEKAKAESVDTEALNSFIWKLDVEGIQEISARPEVEAAPVGDVEPGKDLVSN